MIYQGRMRVKIPVLFRLAQRGDKVPLTLIRNGEEMVVDVVAKPEATLVARSADATYYNFVDWSFQRLSMKFIDTQTPGLPHYERLVSGSKLMSQDWKQVVIPSKVLSDKINIGYEMLRLEQIKQVSGMNVADFA